MGRVRMAAQPVGRVLPVKANAPDQARLQPSPEAGCSAFIVHDMTGSVPDQECKTRERAEAWVRQLTEARPNARPVIQPNKKVEAPK